MIPESLKIGGYTVKVRMKENLLRDCGCCGRFTPCEKLIEIDPAMTEEMRWGTLYHELIEAITEIYCIKPLAEHHSAIDVLGEVLHQVCRDNGEKVLP